MFTFTTLRLSNRQYAMLRKIERGIGMDEIRRLNQITLGSLSARGFIQCGPRSIHLTVSGQNTLVSFYKIEIYRKLASDNLFSGFYQARKRA